MRGSGLEGDHVTEGGAGDGEEHGGLVQKILDTKKKDQEAASSSTTAKTAVTIVSCATVPALSHKYIQEYVYSVYIYRICTI